MQKRQGGDAGLTDAHGGTDRTHIFWLTLIFLELKVPF